MRGAPVAARSSIRERPDGIKPEQISALLHEAGETHHRVFRIVDGADDDWASWYAQWLIDLSELPDLLGVRPVRSELIYRSSSWTSNSRPRRPANPGRSTTH